MKITKIAAILVTAFSLTISSAAASLIPVGKAVGVKLFSDGIMVVGVEPGASGLEKGDLITHVNDSEVETVSQLKELVLASGGSELCVRVNRDGKELIAEVTPEMTDGKYKLGLWIRDSMAGIGTVTYYDPKTGAFGALGHGVNDVDTGKLLPLEQGTIMEAAVASVRKGQVGAPGQLTGSFGTFTDIGEITLNTDYGIFGVTDKGEGFVGQALETASAQEVENGPAEIVSNVEGAQCESFLVEIIKQNDSRDDRNMVIKVTDQRLLDLTGGIVQGMSGSPIIQNGKLIGAVTHVLVSDPTRGYGVYIENMLKHGTKG